MAHGQNARKWGNSGAEWWGKRPLAGTRVSFRGMKKWKRLLRKIERKEWRDNL